MLKDLIRLKEKLTNYHKSYINSNLCIPSDLLNNDNSARNSLKSVPKDKRTLYYFLVYLLNAPYYLKFCNDQLNSPYFELVSKDITLIAQISLSVNLNQQISIFEENRLVLELYSLVALKNGLNVGVRFMKELIKLQKILDIPLTLYCESNLIPYYEKFGFKNTKFINYQGYTLMTYE